MKKKVCTVEQIAALLSQAERGVPVAVLVRRAGVSTRTFYRWRKQYVRPELGQAGQLKQMENMRLKQLVAELTLDKTMLQDVLAKLLESRQRSHNHDDTRVMQYRMVGRSDGRNSTLTEGRDKMVLQ